MSYQAEIIVPLDKQTKKLFLLEDKEIGERANYSIEERDEKLVFIIKAKDASSLRAAFNTITKNLVIKEKVDTYARKN